MENQNQSSLPVVAGVQIPVDDQGRYNLNALHKASGGGANKAPAQWQRTKQAQEFISEIVTMQICTVPINAVNGGQSPGTFAHELVAVEYAGWISPRFRIMVNQTFIDYRMGKLQPITPPLPSDLPTALRLYADVVEKNLKLEGDLKAAAPKITFYNQVTDLTEELTYSFKELLGLIKHFTGQQCKYTDLLRFMREEAIACLPNPYKNIGFNTFVPRQDYIGSWFITVMSENGEVEWRARSLAVIGLIQIMEKSDTLFAKPKTQ